MNTRSTGRANHYCDCQGHHRWRSVITQWCCWNGVQ